MKHFYDAIKTLYGPQPASSSPFLSADGQKLLREKAHILGRWAEHFDAVLNRSSHINEEAINRLPQNTINLNMGNPPTLSELEIAIHQLSFGKAPGADAIPAEVYKHTGPLLRNKFNQLIDVIWDQEIAPPGIQRCVFHSPLQTKRQQTGVRKSQRHLSPLHSWKNTRKDSS